MENINSLQTVVNETDQTISIDSTSGDKPKSIQGKLNRLGEKAQAILLVRGHSDNRFKRDYVKGTATYTCKNCGMNAHLNALAAKENKLGGRALQRSCTNNSQK